MRVASAPNGFNYTKANFSLIGNDSLTADPTTSKSLWRRSSDRCLPVDVAFEWRYDGTLVFLVGSWDNWKSRLPMAKPLSPAEAWRTVLRLPPGIYAFKFVVDDNWCHDMNLEYTRDSEGNVNNIVRVTGPSSRGDAPSKPIERPLPIGAVNR